MSRLSTQTSVFHQTDNPFVLKPQWAKSIPQATNKGGSALVAGESRISSILSHKGATNAATAAKGAREQWSQAREEAGRLWLLWVKEKQGAGGSIWRQRHGKKR